MRISVEIERARENQCKQTVRFQGDLEGKRQTTNCVLKQELPLTELYVIMCGGHLPPV